MDSLFDPEPAEQQAENETDRDGTQRAGEAPDTRPLAVRLRPRSLEQFVGQSHLLAPGSALRTAIEQGRAHSMILYGPPGTGKTTLARMLAEHSQAAFEELSAVQAGRAEVRAVMERALGEGGTSFDALYVNVNGESGYFDRSLAAYGQEGEPCPRCGTPIRRDPFMNRSSFTCPSCQPRPRRARW